MFVLPPYLAEIDTYPRTPKECRWIYNKLELGARLGYDAYPVGSWVPPGDYCLRPMINISGMAKGGFKKVTLTEPRNVVYEPSGYCLTPWSDEHRCWYEFVNDQCISADKTVKIEDDIEYTERTTAHSDMIQMPEPLKGISRYMLVETLGNMVIDVGPRHMTEQMREWVIEDYRQFDPNYEPPAYCTFGYEDKMKRVERDGWTYHEEVRDGVYR